MGFGGHPTSPATAPCPRWERSALRQTFCSSYIRMRNITRAKSFPERRRRWGWGKVLLGKHPSLVWNLTGIGLGWAVSCLQRGLDQRQAAWDSLGLLELLCPLDGVCLILGPPLGHL